MEGDVCWFYLYLFSSCGNKQEITDWLTLGSESWLSKSKGRETWEHERQLESLRNRQASVFSIPSVWLQPVPVNLSSHFLFSHLIYCQLLYQPLRHTHTLSAGLPPPCSLYRIAQLLAVLVSHDARLAANPSPLLTSWPACFSPAP